MRAGLAACALLVVACGSERTAAPRLHAVVAQPVNDSVTDTVRFETDATAWRCEGGRGLLLVGTSGGDGVLLWLRPGDSGFSGEYAPLTRGDTTTPRGAILAVRFVLRDLARGLMLDSGRVVASEGGGRLAARAAGSGTGVPGAVRARAEAAFTDLPTPTDSARCVAQL